MDRRVGDRRKRVLYNIIMCILYIYTYVIML